MAYTWTPEPNSVTVASLEIMKRVEGCDEIARFSKLEIAKGDGAAFSELERSPPPSFIPPPLRPPSFT